MKYLIYLIAIIFLLTINLGLFNHLEIKGQIPNLLFLFTLCCVLEKEDFDFFFVALVSGILLDFYSADFFGAFTVAFLIISFFLHLFINKLMFLGLSWKSLSATLIFSLFSLNFMVWLYGLITFKLGWIGHATGFKVVLSGFLPALFYNVLLLYPVYVFAIFLKRFINNLYIRRRGVVR